MIGLLFLSAVLLADAPDRDRQRHTLHVFREAWSAAQTQSDRDSIVRDIQAAVSNEAVHQSDANEQLQLWEVCCPLWDVEEIPNSSTHSETFDLQRYAVLEIDGVTFYRFDSTYSKNSDTMYTASNDVPGYGGIDIHYSYLKYFAVVNKYNWIPQNNIGLGINTGADEFGFTHLDTIVTFYRLQNNTVRKFRAVPRKVIQHVILSDEHLSIPFVYVSVLDCRDYVVAAAAIDPSTSFYVPTSAANLVFTCCRTSQPRTFSRCVGSVNELELHATDIRAHVCESDVSPLSRRDSVEIFSFSIYEDRPSAEAALQNVLHHIVKEGRYVSRVRVESAPNHLSEQLTSMIAELTNQRITTHITTSTSPRTSIVVERKR